MGIRRAQQSQGIPDEIARDTEVAAAISAHEAAPDPHPGYLSQAEGDSRYRDKNTLLTDADIPATIARDSEIYPIAESAIAYSHVNSPEPHPNKYRRKDTPLTDADIPAGIARDVEVATAIGTHRNESQPHTYPIGLLIPNNGGNSAVRTLAISNVNGSREWNWQLDASSNIVLHSFNGSQWGARLGVTHEGVIATTMPTSSVYGGISVSGAKNGYAGINFVSAFNTPVFMQHTTSFIHGIWAPTGAVNGWTSLYNQGSFRIYNDIAQTEGSFIGLEKGLGSLPGFPANRFPAVSTDFNYLYFSIGGTYSAYMTTNGTLVAVSDRNRKENAIELNYSDVLKKITEIPIYRYNFRGEDPQIQRAGCYAQDFYTAFGLGGSEEIDADDSPTTPSKMIAPADAIGICMAAIQGLAKQVDELRAELNL
jgi:hypothetical protein